MIFLTLISIYSSFYYKFNILTQANVGGDNYIHLRILLPYSDIPELEEFQTGKKLEDEIERF